MCARREGEIMRAAANGARQHVAHQRVADDVDAPVALEMETRGAGALLVGQSLRQQRQTVGVERRSLDIFDRDGLAAARVHGVALLDAGTKTSRRRDAGQISADPQRQSFKAARVQDLLRRHFAAGASLKRSLARPCACRATHSFGARRRCSYARALIFRRHRWMASLRSQWRTGVSSPAAASN